MEHIFIEKQKQAPVWLLLHGTGGDEHSLVPLAQSLLPEASILSLRGDVVENGMNRFFKRFAEGDFDLENLAVQTEKLAALIRDLAKEYQIDESHLIGMGYSNGANMLGHYLLTKPSQMTKAILFHNMLLTDQKVNQDLTGKEIWLSFGQNDPIVPRESFMGIKHLLEAKGVQTTVMETPFSHGIERSELEALHRWLQQ